MKISIISPSFNQAQFIGSMFESVLQQPYPNWEIVVADGASTDGTVALLQQYHQRYPEKIRYISETDTGQSNALNKALRLCTGDIIAWLSTDDYYEPNIFQYVVDIFTQQPDVMVVYGQCDTVDETITPATVQPYYVAPFNYELLLNRRNFIPEAATFFRRQVYQHIGGFDEQLSYVMDFDYWLRAATVGKIIFVPKKLANFRVHTQSKTGSRNTGFFKEALAVSRKYGGKTMSGYWWMYQLEPLYYWYNRTLGALPGLGWMKRGMKRLVQGKLAVVNQQR
ncbi:MAG: glycosyltransferase [Candidatus Kerfeldbacteria bacterium]|nr:glycosyltransferase [Candidatus Kerfeldbacteria bacterium]